MSGIHYRLPTYLPTYIQGKRRSAISSIAEYIKPKNNGRDVASFFRSICPIPNTFKRMNKGALKRQLLSLFHDRQGNVNGSKEK